MKKAQIVMAAALMLMTVAAVGMLIYLVYVFPGTVSVWDQEARALSFSEKLLANTSGLCRRNGLVLFPVLLLGFLTSLLWTVIAARKKCSPNNEVHAVS